MFGIFRSLGHIYIVHEAVDQKIVVVCIILYVILGAANITGHHACSSTVACPNRNEVVTQSILTLAMPLS